MTDLNASYQFCVRIARTRARNFYYSFLLLSSEQKLAMCAIYAFMRYSGKGIPLLLDAGHLAFAGGDVLRAVDNRNSRLVASFLMEKNLAWVLVFGMAAMGIVWSWLFGNVSLGFQLAITTIIVGTFLLVTYFAILVDVPFAGNDCPGLRDGVNLALVILRGA